MPEKQSSNDPVPQQTNEAAVKKVEDSPSSNSKSKELANVLDSYFEHDMNLRQTYRVDVSIEDLRKLRMVQAMKPEADVLLEAVQICKKLKLNEEKTKVRAVLVQGRTTLILRDLPRDVQYEHIKKLLESEELVSQLDSKVKEIRPELNETWFVRFSTQEDCLKAAEWLTFHGKIKGQKVRCRVKSVLPSTYSPNPSPQYPSPNYGNPNFNQYAPQQSPNVFGASGFGMPQISPNGLPFMQGMPPSPLFGAMMNQQGHQGRRSSGRRSQRGNNQRQNSYRGQPQLPRQQSYKRQKSNRANKNQPPKPVSSDNDPDYQNAFKLIERTNFHDITRNALANNEDEPKIPEKLKAFPGLLAKTPKIHFDQTALVNSAAISPMPETVSGGEMPPKLNLSKSGKQGKGKKSITKTFSKTPIKEEDDEKDESPKKQTAI